ncbi:MAG: glycosyltransferase family 2 protein [Myxococcales bacterium]|nr:glycosyltransferase family 2 protein [Myxococcales bacterium]
MKVSLIIAAHNEVATIADVVTRGRAALGDECLEVIVVDDGSKDGTGAAATSAGAHVYRLSPNQGKGRALRTGINASRGDWLVFIDADGQDDPAEIPALLDAVRSHPDVALVNGSRFIGKLESGAISPPNLVGNLAFTGLFDLLYGARITDTQAGFRAVRGDVARSLVLESTEYEIETEMLAKILGQRLRVLEVPVTRRARAAGTTDFRRVRNGLRILATILRRGRPP